MAGAPKLFRPPNLPPPTPEEEAAFAAKWQAEQEAKGGAKAEPARAPRAAKPASAPALRALRADEAPEPRAEGRRRHAAQGPLALAETGYIFALGKLTILDGRPGIFKSGMCFDLAARVTTGGAMPGFTQPDLGPADVIVLGEDDPEDTIVPRLMSAGADLSRVHFGPTWCCPARRPPLRRGSGRSGRGSSSWTRSSPSSRAGTTSTTTSRAGSRFARSPRRRGGPSARSSACATRRSPRPRPARPRTAAPARRRSASRRGRTLLPAGDPDGAVRYVLASIKNNLGPEPPSLGYHVEEVYVDTPDGAVAVPVVRWDGEVNWRPTT